MRPSVINPTRPRKRRKKLLHRERRGKEKRKAGSFKLGPECVHRNANPGQGKGVDTSLFSPAAQGKKRKTRVPTTSAGREATLQTKRKKKKSSIELITPGLLWEELCSLTSPGEREGGEKGRETEIIVIHTITRPSPSRKEGGPPRLFNRRSLKGGGGRKRGDWRRQSHPPQRAPLPTEKKEPVLIPLSRKKEKEKKEESALCISRSCGAKAKWGGKGKW